MNAPRAMTTNKDRRTPINRERVTMATRMTNAEKRAVTRGIRIRVSSFFRSADSFLLPRSAPATRQAGSVLTVVLVTGAVIGITLTSFMTLVNAHNRATVRSQSWNACIAVVEAGIEDAMGHCAHDYITNMAANGWTLTNSAYTKTKSVISSATTPTGGFAKQNGYYTATISSSLPYTILCTGYYPLPGTSQYLSRTVRITTTNDGVFSAGMIVKTKIDMNGNNLKTDSYDSTNPNKSTLNKYDPLKAGDKGDIACVFGLTNSVDIGNANIWGHVYTGPKGSIKYGPLGSVGDVAWQTSG